MRARKKVVASLAANVLQGMRSQGLNVSSIIGFFSSVRDCSLFILEAQHFGRAPVSRRRLIFN
jgi:hypothetical protein